MFLNIYKTGSSLYQYHIEVLNSTSSVPVTGFELLPVPVTGSTALEIPELVQNIYKFH